ncbi:MAG: hypothetical protein VX700_05295, partial [Pseudomonadota bacterium]|nr:hypothetical protein [Pseudomonadota bacterium]
MIPDIAGNFWEIRPLRLKMRSDIRFRAIRFTIAGSAAAWSKPINQFSNTYRKCCRLMSVVAPDELEGIYWGQLKR